MIKASKFVKNTLIKNLKYFVLAFLALTPSCSIFHQSPYYCKLSNQIIKEYTSVLKREYGLCCIGGGGAMMDNIKEITLTYICYAPMNIDEARNLYVAVIEGYLERVNQCEAIRPYLNQYPFEWHNFDLHLMFFNKQNNFAQEGVATIFQGKEGQIVYCGYNGEELYTLLRESPQEAAALVNR